MEVRGVLAPSLARQLEPTGMEHVWVGQSGRQALGVGPSGIGLFRSNEDSHVLAWSDVVAITLHSRSYLVVASSAGPVFDFAFAAAKQASEVLETVPALEKERLGLNHGFLMSNAPTALASAPGSSIEEREGASQTLWSLLFSGAGLQLVGGVIAGAAWPSTRLDPLAGKVSEEGSSLITVLGLLLMSGGAMLMLVAVIAFGVRFGIRAAHEDAHGQ
jgi:hypothetical protein